MVELCESEDLVINWFEPQLQGILDDVRYSGETSWALKTVQDSEVGEERQLRQNSPAKAGRQARQCGLIGRHVEVLL